VALAALVLLTKAPTLGIPPYWDEVRYIEQARWLAERSLIEALPGFRPAGVFFGHPPGLHALAAATWKVTGVSVPVAHLLIAGFAAIGVCATFLLGRHLHGTREGLLAAVLLLLCPLYFAQAGMFLADVPVAALGVLSAWYALRNRYAAWVVTAAVMVLLKETAVAIVAAVVAYRFLAPNLTWRGRIVDALRYSAPLAAIVAFVVLQRITTGHFFFIYDFDIDLVALDAGTVRQQFEEVVEWIFVNQYRGLLTAVIVVDHLVNAEARRRRELLLFGLVLLLSGFSFSVLFFMPRYLLPVMPFYYILAAASVVRLAQHNRFAIPAAVAAAAVMAWPLVRSPLRGNGETNLAYFRVVRLQRVAAQELAEKFPDARILTTGRLTTQLTDPLFGYVERPLTARNFRGAADSATADLILVSSPTTDRSEELRDLARQSQWRLASRSEDGPISMEIYISPRADTGR
jgi:4-amino-4-deoxy-L-arabinose transferase-like glycosyltransferase